MKELALVALAIWSVGAFSPEAFAAKGDKKAKGDKDGNAGKADDVYALYDANDSGVFEDGEKMMMKKVYETQKGPPLSALDTNHDGVLSDDELKSTPKSSQAKKEDREQKRKREEEKKREEQRKKERSRWNSPWRRGGRP